MWSQQMTGLTLTIYNFLKSAGSLKTSKLIVTVFSVFFFHKKCFLKCIAGYQIPELTKVEVLYNDLNPKNKG